jgi:hypothetical protein
MRPLISLVALLTTVHCFVTPAEAVPSLVTKARRFLGRANMRLGEARLRAKIKATRMPSRFANEIGKHIEEVRAEAEKNGSGTGAWADPFAALFGRQVAQHYVQALDQVGGKHVKMEISSATARATANPTQTENPTAHGTRFEFRHVLQSDGRFATNQKGLTWFSSGFGAVRHESKGTNHLPSAEILMEDPRSKKVFSAKVSGALSRSVAEKMLLDATLGQRTFEGQRRALLEQFEKLQQSTNANVTVTLDRAWQD